MKLALKTEFLEQVFPSQNTTKMKRKLVLTMDISSGDWPALPKEDAMGKTGQEHTLKLIGKLIFLYCAQRGTQLEKFGGKRKRKKTCIIISVLNYKTRNFKGKKASLLTRQYLTYLMVSNVIN